MVPAGFGIGFENRRLYSVNPPDGLAPGQVPQFVSIGFDDNAYSGWEGSKGQGGMKWALDFFKDKKNPDGSGNPRTYDGEPCRVSFYVAASFASSNIKESAILVKKAWHQAWADGHEIGNHSFSHSGDLKRNTSLKRWSAEIEQCDHFLSEPYNLKYLKDPKEGIGLDRKKIYGFRAPYLSYTYETFTILKKIGFLYDCSIEDGWQSDQNGSNYCWPYTLDQGSPGDNLIWNWPDIERPRPIGRYPGLWELPIHPLVVPPDDQCAKYGIPAGLRKKIDDRIFWFDEVSGKLPCFDYNLYFIFGLSKEEALAVLKYTFDLHYNGNRAPLALGVHSDIYSSKYPFNGSTNFLDRQWVLEHFVDYILTKPDVRIVPAYKIIQWCSHPVPISAAMKEMAVFSPD